MHRAGVKDGLKVIDPPYWQSEPVSGLVEALFNELRF